MKIVRTEVARDLEKIKDLRKQLELKESEWTVNDTVTMELLDIVKQLVGVLLHV